VPQDLDSGINEIVQGLKTQYDSLDIRSIKKPLQTKVTNLIVDQLLVLTVELKDDSKESSEEAIGLATYSNIESSVLTHTSIFESLWMETELLQHRRSTTTMI
jgi:hypothetical protein